MLTILDILNRTTNFFKEKGIPDPRLDAEYLVGHALGKKRLDLFLEFDRPLPEESLESIRALVRRRAKREPLQHILGDVEFCGLRLKCDSRALIPRPETERLVERTRELLMDKPGPDEILELGTGCGAIALALAGTCPEAGIVATDISEEALDLARENSHLVNAQGRIDFINTNWLDGIEGQYDLIISNPPYLSGGEIEEAEPEVRDYEPRLALESGKDGFSALEQLVRGAMARLMPGGLLALETGISQEEGLNRVADEVRYSRYFMERDLQKRWRYFFAWK